MKLHIEFNVDAKSNSGVYLRGRYEIQILDNPDPKMALDSHGCGGVYSRIAPRMDATKPAGEWQAFDIEIVGRQVSVTLNGKKIVEGVRGRDHRGRHQPVRRQSPGRSCCRATTARSASATSS